MSKLSKFDKLCLVAVAVMLLFNGATRVVHRTETATVVDVSEDVPEENQEFSESVGPSRHKAVKVSRPSRGNGLTLEAYFGMIPNDDKGRYVRRFAKVAIDMRKRGGEVASLAMAQAMCESAAGQSEAAREGHAHFCIKYQPSVPHREMVTGHRSDEDGLPGRRKMYKFCTYRTDWDSWNHHRVWMASFNRYDKVRGAPDFDSALRALVRSGYSENGYHGGKSLRTLADQYKLRSLDLVSL